MKKSVKVFWSMCCALVVMGGVFTLAGILLGMDVRAVSETFHIDEQNLEAFQEIDIAVITADIEVVYSDHYESRPEGERARQRGQDIVVCVGRRAEAERKR